MTGVKEWYLSRNGFRYGPFSWEEVIQYSQSGRISQTDLLWSPSSGGWFPAGRLDYLFPAATTGFQSKPTAKKRKKGLLAAGGAVLLAAGCIVLTVILAFISIAAFRQDRVRVPDIIDYYPQSGPAGSHVYLLFDGDTGNIADDLSAYYNNERIFIADIFEDYAEVILPDDATSGEIEIRSIDETSNPVAFTVEGTTLTKLYEEMLEPSDTEQTIQYKDEITITIPPGVIDQPRKLSISLVENAPVNSINPLANIAIDITIEGLSQLNDYIGIGMRFDPEALDPALSSADQLMALRYDEQHGFWLPLPLWVDETNQMIYMETDHLSYLGAFSVIPGAISTVITKAPLSVCIAGLATTAWISERLTFTSYTTDHFRVLYHHGAMDIIYRDWQNSPYAGQLQSYDDNYPQYIQDMGAIFEQAFENYMERGFRNPVVRPGRLYGERHDPITIKLSGFWSVASGYVGGSEEPQYGKIFGNVHLPMYIFRQPDERVLPAVGHELFHVIQSRYYRMHRYLQWLNTGDYWWIEATAEYAGFREAWGRNNKQYDNVMHVGLSGEFFNFPLNSTDLQGSMTKDYEYLASFFIRFLVDERQIDFKDLFEYVAEGEPFERLDRYIRDHAPADRFVDFELAYIMFARWGFFSADSFLSRFPTLQVADQIDSMNLSEVGQSLEIKISDNEDVWFEIFKSEDQSRSSTWDYNIPLAVLGSGPGEVTIDDLNKGEVVYVLAVNNTQQNHVIPVQVTLVDADPSDDSSAEQTEQATAQDQQLSHTFNISGGHTARLWAIEIANDPVLEIQPEEISEAKINEEYTFNLNVSNLPQNPVTEVDFAWDFGDERNNSTGSQTAVPVRNGRASIEITYIYEMPDESYTMTASVKNSANGEKLAETTAYVIFDEYMVIIEGERPVTVAIPKQEEDVEETEYVHEHFFEAVVRPVEEAIFQFEWNFGDGQTFSETGETSSHLHTYQDVKIGDEFSVSVSITLPGESEVISEDSIKIIFVEEDDSDLTGIWTGTMQMTDISGALRYAEWLSEWIVRGIARIIVPIVGGEMLSDEEIQQIARDSIEVNQTALEPHPMVVELARIDKNIYQAYFTTTVEGVDNYYETTAEFKNGRLIFNSFYDDGYVGEFALALEGNYLLSGEFEINLSIFQSVKYEIYLYR